MNQEQCLGIDIGGTSTKIGLVTRQGELRAFDTFPSRARESFDWFIADLTRHVQKLLEGQTIRGIGIGAPDASPLDGTMRHAANFNWGACVPLVEAVEKALGYPTALTNDANAAALGEWYFGVAKGMTDFVVITLGTGVGSGFVADGHLLQGKRGMAGEFGHVVVVPGGRQCSCGQRGCLEMYASARGIRLTALECVAEAGNVGPLAGYTLETMSVRKIEAAARRGDEAARRTFKISGRILGRKLADLVAIFDTEAIILSGGVSRAGDLLLKPVAENMEAFTFPAFRGKTRLLTSQMKNVNAAVLGAAALAFNVFDQK